MKLLMIIVAALFLSGCVASQLDKIPKGEFEEFGYDRAGNFSSVHIIALGAKKTHDIVIIDTVSVTVDYGPFVNFKMYLKGYKRPRTTETKETEDLGIEP